MECDCFSFLKVFHKRPSIGLPSAAVCDAMPIGLPSEIWSIGDDTTEKSDMDRTIILCENWRMGDDDTGNNSEMIFHTRPSIGLPSAAVCNSAMPIGLPSEIWSIGDDDTGNNFGMNPVEKPFPWQSIPCIYKVPGELRSLKESAYQPRVVSIGPVHSNDEGLNAMEHIKLSYKDSLCFRTGGTKCMSITLERCRSAMVDLEARVENCYAEKVKLINEKQNSLAEMMLIDGCFILELLYRSYFVKKKSVKISTDDDPIFGNPVRLLAIRHDLLLLENQIPLFVLQKLFSLTVECIPDNPNHLSLTKYVLSFFGNILSFGKDTLRKKVDTIDYHILDLLRNCYIPSHDPWEGEKDHTRFLESGKSKSRFPSASDLDLAGVKFVAGVGEDLFNINFIKPRGHLKWFHRARFEIPALFICDGTELLLRNFIAFEQCCAAIPHHITSYSFFMYTLINSSKDVKLLENAKILHNNLGTSEEASDLFNNICKGVVVGKFYFAETYDVASNHCREQ